MNQKKALHNPYQYTRGIRFRGDLKKESENFKEKYNWNGEGNSSDPKQLLDSLNEFNIKLFDFYDNKKAISINKTWIKFFHKEIFYNEMKRQTNNQGRFPLIELKEQLVPLFKNWKENSKNLKHAFDRPKETLSRHSDISEYLRRILSRNQLFCIKELLNETSTEFHDSHDLDESLKCLKADLKEVEEQLKKVSKNYLYDQSSGMEIAKASLNYYTVNKKSKEYYNDECTKVKNKLYKIECTKVKNKLYKIECTKIIQRDNSYCLEIYSKENLKKYKENQSNKENNNNSPNNNFELKGEQEKEWIKKWLEKNKDNYLAESTNKEFFLTLDQTYKLMKRFKGEQKFIFTEIASHITSKNNERRDYKIKNKQLLLHSYTFQSSDLFNRSGFYNIENIRKEFSLFCKPKDQDTYKKNGKTIDKLKGFLELKTPKEKNLDNKHKYSLSKERSSFFNMLHNHKKNCFEPYRQFCLLYRNIAQERGCLIAQLKGIEREKREAKETGYWGIIYCDQNKKQLWLIPRYKKEHKDKDQSNMGQAREFIKKNGKKVSVDELQYLCIFESLTMRALHKLCFAEESTFVKEMDKDLKLSQENTKRFKTKGNEEKLKEKNQKELCFFKNLLKSKYAEERLSLEHFKLEEVSNSENLEDFEKNLEDACYDVQKVIFNENEKDKFLKEFDVTVINISSYDLEDRNKKEEPHSENKYHTKLWESFWNNLDNPNRDEEVEGFVVGKVRLNPEIKIRYRMPSANLKTYFKERGFPSTFKHRRLQEQFTVQFTLSLNAGKKHEDLAFSKPEYIFKKIDEFNEKRNKEMGFKTIWKYGIDRGTRELATLCLVKFNFDKNDDKKSKPQWSNIECYTLKDTKYKGESYKTKRGEEKIRSAIKNLSYFIKDKYLKDQKNIFKKKNTSCLDLTTAKLIKGKIITNGDVMTYLKFKKAIAKRVLYNYFYKKTQKIDSIEWSCFEYKNNEKINSIEGNSFENEDKKKDNEQEKIFLNIKSSDFQETIYRYNKDYKDIIIDDKDKVYSKDYIKSSLNLYLEELKKRNESHTPSILKINQLRSALTANAIGIITHLYKEHPGFVLLEDLQKINPQFQYDKGIYRKLENALYSKFQSIGLVPPHTKNLIDLREELRKREKEKNNTNKENQSAQIGAIVFVPETDTSQDCPHCGEKSKHKIPKEDLKFRQHRFICTECHFDTYLFKDPGERTKNYCPKISEKSEEKQSNFQYLETIDDPDKVAAYNIAKKITDPYQIKKWESNKKNSDK